ncbi:MAG TPA: hydroxysqualene dehydroxylase HpnE [Mycobacteriales bacterium]|nr:hydroxysqualene dehydroxylase HpnE [Mycobacteriales bacterium]
MTTTDSAPPAGAPTTPRPVEPRSGQPRAAEARAAEPRSAEPRAAGPGHGPDRRRPHAVVIGGGLAGITAALGLADAAVPTTLLERRPRLGGATTSFQHGELTVDNGQHVFLRCCTEYRALLRRLGVAGQVTLQDRLDVTVLAPGGVRARLRRDPLPAPAHLTSALAGYRHLTPLQRAKVVRGALALRRLDPADRSLDTRTLGDFLAAHGQSEQMLAAFWDVFAIATLNLPARQASLQTAAKVFRTGLLDTADAGDIGWSAVPLGDLHGTAGLRALTAAGVATRTHAVVRGVEPTGDGWLVHTEADGPIRADTVVLAVPAADAEKLLPPGALPAPERLAALGASPIVNVHVIYDRPVLPVPLAAAVRSPVQWVFDRTGPSGLTDGQYLAVSVSAADGWIDRPTAEIRETFLPALAGVLPGARHARIREFFVTRERRATFRQRVGSAALRPGPATALPGLVLAGAWTDTGWPDTMESAVRSGRSAVRGALDHLTRTSPTRRGAADRRGGSAA